MRALTLALAVLLLGCQATGPIQSLQGAGDAQQITEEESRLWLRGREFDAAIAKSDQLYDDPATTAYIQSVMDRLYPEFAGVIKVRIVKTPVLNAFALPNGSIYFHVGLLARLDNEAQLAAVLAHEGAHFIRKHGLQQTRNVKGASVFALGLGLAGIPLVGDLIAMSSIYGYSRDLEREADRDGYERMVRAGYDAREAGKTFLHLKEEVEVLDIKEPFFFSSHPALTERIDSFNELTKGYQPTQARVAQNEFLSGTAALRTATLEADLSAGRHKSVILVLEKEANRARYPSYASYYLGEAYRQRGGEGDAQRAEGSYLKAISAAPDFAPSYRALGVHYMKSKNPPQALAYLRKYLELAPRAPDRAYVEQYIAKINRENAT